MTAAAAPPNLLRLVAGFFAAQRQFDARCFELLGLYDKAPGDVRRDLAALLVEHRIYKTLTYVEDLWALIDDRTRLQLRPPMRLRPRLVCTNPRKE
jgi:hypothetical protein